MTEYDGDGGSEIPEIPTDSVVSEPDSVPQTRLLSRQNRQRTFRKAI